jgi:ribulose-phosphate 3-epimerase
MADGAVRRLAGGGPWASIGILTADLARAGEEVARLEAAGASIVHVDVMDGVFCPPLTLGPPFIGALRTPLLKDAHLMVADPLAHVDAVVAAGADLVTVHVESGRTVRRALVRLGRAANANDPERGIVRAIGINPGTPLEAIEPLLDEAEMVLVLAVDPGYAGQSFAASTPRRVERARALIEASGRRILLGVDGGVTRANAAAVAALGADLVVTGSAVFDGGDAVANARAMLAILERRAVPS